MGQRDAFSSQDIQKLNKMYKCNGAGFGVNEIKPPMTSHNNINELINESEETGSTAVSTTTKPATAANRPNRPLLNLFGSLVNQVLSQARP